MLGSYKTPQYQNHLKYFSAKWKNWFLFQKKGYFLKAKLFREVLSIEFTVVCINYASTI